MSTINEQPRLGGAQAKLENEEIALQGSGQIDIIGLVYAVLAKYRIILACAIAGALIMCYYSLHIVTPVYQATSKLYSVNAQGALANSLNLLNIGSAVKWDYEEILSTWEVRERVLQNLQLDMTYQQLGEAVRVSASQNSRILTINAYSHDPKEAMDLANEYAVVSQEYIAQIMSTDEPPIVTHALEPTKPINNDLRGLVMRGFLVGALVPAAAAAALFLLDDKVRTPEDVQRAVSIPTFAVLPLESKKQPARRRKARWKNA